MLITLSLIVSLSHALLDAFRYPEEHSPIAKYHLSIDLANGNQDAIDYYNARYVANGKYLFGDKYIVEDEYLNMATVIGYEVSDGGVLLLTSDGKGYFIEK